MMRWLSRSTAVLGLILLGSWSIAAFAADMVHDAGDLWCGFNTTIVPDTLGEVSATAVRAAAAAGRRLDQSAVPPETAHFLRDTRVFGAALRIAGQAVDAYALRQRLLRLLFAVRGLGGAQVEFAGLMRRALAADGQGRALRRATSGAEVLEALRRYSNGSAG